MAMAMTMEEVEVEVDLTSASEVDLTSASPRLLKQRWARAFQPPSGRAEGVPRHFRRALTQLARDPCIMIAKPCRKAVTELSA